MIKFKTNKVLKDIKGVPFDDNGKPILIADIISNALADSRKNHAHCFKLAKDFATKKEVVLKAEDIVLIKSVILDERFGLPALTVGQILEAFGETESPEEGSESN